MSSIPATAAATSTPLYAGFWRRYAAWSIDYILIGVAILSITLPFSFNELLAQLGFAVLFFAYVTVMHSSALQTTVGKLLMGVKVTDREGNRIGIGRSLGRSLGWLVSCLSLGIGFVMAGHTERRQALHDMMAGTLVVRRGATPAEIVAGGGAMPVTMPVIVVLVIVNIVFPVVVAIAIAIATFPSRS